MRPIPRRSDRRTDRRTTRRSRTPQERESIPSVPTRGTVEDEVRPDEEEWIRVQEF